MEKRKILGLSLLGAGTAAAGLGIYTLVNALTLNHKTEEAKSKESAAVNNVINSVYGSTEKDAKDMGMAAGLLAGASVAGALLMFGVGGVLLSPKGIKLQQMKLAKIGAIASGVIAAGAPILGAVSVGLYHTPTVQQAKQFIDFSKEFEEVFMGNINAVETRARDMLETAGWIEFKDLLKSFETDASAFKISDADKTKDEAIYFKHLYLVAANMYVMAGKDVLDTTVKPMASSLASDKYFTDKNEWKTANGDYTHYFDQLNKLKDMRNNFLPEHFSKEDRDEFNAKNSGQKLDLLEGFAVQQAAKSTVNWFKNFMKSYHKDFGDKATSEVITITLAKLAYVSGNKNISTINGPLATALNGNKTQKAPMGSDTLSTTFMIPNIQQFANVKGLKLDNGHYVLTNELSSTIGIDELTNTYKPSWLQDPLKYIFTTQAPDTTKVDLAELTKIAAVNKNINLEYLKPYFENNHSLYISNKLMMTDFSNLDLAVNGGLMMAYIPQINPAANPTDPAVKVFENTLAAVKANSLKTIPQILTHSAASYFVEMKLGLAKNYVQSVMNEISNVLTNSPDDIYK